MNCKHCGKKFLGKNAIFCGTKCYKIHVKELEERIKVASKNDPSHTQKMTSE